MKHNEIPEQDHHKSKEMKQNQYLNIRYKKFQLSILSFGIKVKYEKMDKHQT